MVGRHPEDVFEEEIVAVKCQTSEDEQRDCCESSQVLQISPFVDFENVRLHFGYS